MTRLVFWIVAGLLAAGLVHGVSLLLIPLVAPATAYDRLAVAQTDGRFALLPDTDPLQQPLPFEDTTFIEAVCRYDLAGGPVRVFAPFAVSYGSITFYTRFGQAFYSLTDKAAARNGVNVVVLDREQVDIAETVETTDEQREALRIVSPTRAGFALLRLHVPSPSTRSGLKELTQSARCVQTAGQNEAVRAAE